MTTKNDFFTLIKLAEFIDVPFYKIRYALSVGNISKPSNSLNGRPIWSYDEAMEIKKLFKKEDA